MKKFPKIIFSTALFNGFLLSLLFSFTSCNIELKDRNLAAAPEVTQTESGIFLTISPLASTKYINIYRRDVTDVSSSDRNNLPYEKIGILYPGNYITNDSKLPKSYGYEDIYVSKDSTYQYCIRYSTVTAKTNSDWSKDIKPKETTTSLTASDLTYSTKENEINICYDETAKTIYLKENLPVSDILREFEPMIAITDGNTSKIFKLPDTIISDPEKYSKNCLLGGKENDIPLLSILSDDYLSSDEVTINLTILGLVGQYNNYESLSDDDSKRILSTTWTPLAKIRLIDTNNQELSTISVMNPTGVIGTDWSDF